MEGVSNSKQHYLACDSAANFRLCEGLHAACRTAGLADLGMAIDAETHSTQAGTMARCIGNVIYVLQARPGVSCRLRAACGRNIPCHSETLAMSLCMLSRVFRGCRAGQVDVQVTLAHRPECLHFSEQQ